MPTENHENSLQLRFSDQKTYFVVADSDGIWITESPDINDEILYVTQNLFLAETVLCRETSSSD